MVAHKLLYGVSRDGSFVDHRDEGIVEMERCVPLFPLYFVFHATLQPFTIANSMILQFFPNPGRPQKLKMEVE